MSRREGRGCRAEATHHPLLLMFFVETAPAHPGPIALRPEVKSCRKCRPQFDLDRLLCATEATGLGGADWVRCVLAALGLPKVQTWDARLEWEEEGVGRD